MKIRITKTDSDTEPDSPDTDRRSADPALAAAAAFAVMLASNAIDVSSEPVRGHAGAGATVLAAARSAPLSDIVEHMLAVSDNDEAEVLARHLARAGDLPATSEAAEQAIVLPRRRPQRSASRRRR